MQKQDEEITKKMKTYSEVRAKKIKEEKDELDKKDPIKGTAAGAMERLASQILLCTWSPSR